MVRLGLDLPPELLALACASHSGEAFHVEGVRRILPRAGLDESALQTPPDYPLDDDAREARASAPAAARRPIADELLGQARRDAGHLRGATAGTPRPTATPDHPLQAAIAATFAELTGEPVDDGRRSTAAVRRCCPTSPDRAGPGVPAGCAGSTARRPTRGSGWPTRSAAHPEYVSGTHAGRGAPCCGHPRRDRQGRRGVLLRGRAARRPRVRAQDRRRRAAGPPGADGRGAAPQRRATPSRASTPRRCAGPARSRCSAAASPWARSGAVF